MGTYSGAGGMLGAGEGIARSSRFRRDPPMHILQKIGNDWATWCSGAPGMAEQTMNARRCPRCVTLLREWKRTAVEDGDMQPDDYLDESWGV